MRSGVNTPRGGQANRFRIIGGAWRGRRLRFPPEPGVRPTPDRVRETLFNWLAGVLPGARCLDLFAGSGALGLEALSRGAAEAVFVDRSCVVCAALRGHIEVLGANGRVVEGEAAAYLAGPAQPFDVVFLDPPYRAGHLATFGRLLAHGGWLAPGARLYLEAEAELGEPPVAAGWRIVRSGRAGDVGYHLAEV